MSQDLQLIIIDVMMPKLDGLSAVLKIRERKTSDHDSVRQKRGYR